MKLFTAPAILIGMASILFLAPVGAEEKLERGKDRIDVSAIGTGLSVHNLFQSNMVIQRDKPIRVWGWAEPGEKVSVAFGDQTQSATAAADRSWTVELKAEKASSEPHRLVVKGHSKTIELGNILLGDIWLLGGQSNMEFEISKVDSGDLEIVSANFKNIRLFTVPHLNGPDHKSSFPMLYQWSDWSKQHFRQGYWDVCTPLSVRDMSAIGYVFARRLHMATNIPIGVIDASRGGTTLETWTPMEVLTGINTPEVKSKLSEWSKKVAEFNPKKDLEDRIRVHKDQINRLKGQGKEIPANSTLPTDLQPGPAMDMNRPGNCYASMIAPISGFPIKGAVWHQGYNNALQPNGHAIYYQVFSKMVGAWRAAFKDPQLPFGIISLCTEGDPQDRDDYLERMANEGIYIREVQFKTFLDFLEAGDKNIGYASSYDQRRSWFHPQIKIPVGERIARWALATQYGMSKQIRWMPPMLKDVRIEGGKMILQLDTAAGPYHDGPIEGFAISGKDGHFQAAKAEWLTTKDQQNKPQHDRSVIVLSSSLVPEPKYFRHAWGRNPQANLKSTDHTDLPFPTLRNDSWTIADMYELYTGKKPATPNVLDRREHGDLIKALRDEDLKRHMTEAKEFLKANEK
ncbi:sialate O-acetylesterase [soil metagenome]